MFKIKLKDKAVGEVIASTVLNVIFATIYTGIFASMGYIAAYAGGMCEPEFWTSSNSDQWLALMLMFTAMETFKIKPTGFLGNTIAKIWNSNILMYIVCIMMVLLILATLYIKYNCLE